MNRELILTSENGSGLLICKTDFPQKEGQHHVLDNVTPGNNVPDSFNVIIEIPMNADPSSTRVDKASGAIFVDRFMSTAMHYPTNYGYVPKTISGDGDPVDVLVVTPVPLIPGVVVPCHWHPEDARRRLVWTAVAVPTNKILSLYSRRGKP